MYIFPSYDKVCKGIDGAFEKLQEHDAAPFEIYISFSTDINCPQKFTQRASLIRWSGRCIITIVKLGKIKVAL